MSRTSLVVYLALSIAGCSQAMPEDISENGGPCSVAGECLGDVCLTELGTNDDLIEFEEGLCTASCDGMTGDGCFDGEHCLTHVATEQANCYQGCTYGQAGECRDGYHCVSVAFLTFACMPPTPSTPL